MLCLHAVALLFLLLANDWRSEAEAFEREGQIDRAIARVEGHLSGAPDDAEAWRWLAGAFERLAGREQRSPLFLSEAAAAWDRAAELGGDGADEAALAAARSRLVLGEYSLAEEGALRVAELRGERGEEGAAEALALALRARMGITASRTRAGDLSLAAGLAEIRTHVAAARESSNDAPDVLVVEAAWLATLQLNDEARATLRGALDTAPSAVALHRAFVDLHLAAEIEQRLPAAYEDLLAAHPDDAVVLWYAGLAQRLAGDVAARERRNADAAGAYARCVTLMRASAELEPSFAETALWVEMQARTASAWSALDGDDTERADAEWAALAEEAPEYAQRLDGLGRTAAQGLGRLGNRYLVRDELDSSRRVSKHVAELTEEAWAWNNVAYLLREIASDTEASGDPAAWDVARSTFVESWQTYLRAAELAPNEPRIVNDAALIQVYHLQDDLDKAEAMLKRAIAVGEAQLEEMGPFADESDRFPVAMAVGDSYQNLGFLYYRVRNEPLKARGYFVKSVATNSGVRRGVRASIQAIDAGRDASDREMAGRPAPQPQGGGGGAASRPKQEPGSTQQEPVDVSPDSRGKPPEERGEGGEQIVDETAPNIDWERSIEAGLAVGENEGRRVLVYHRIGGGIGPSVEYLQRHLHSEDFAAQTSGAITVLADVLRHTFTDRRRDGRIVLCPRAGGMTCGEHIRCAEEFAPLWRASFDMVLGLESNGLFRVTADGLSRATQVEDVFERYRAPEEADGADTSVPEPDLIAARVDQAAGDELDSLAQSTSLPARRALERIVFEEESGERRGRAVVALAEHPGPDNDELMRTLVRQNADPTLSVLALDAWRFELGSADPLHALQTSTQPAVRMAAARALARLGDEDATRALVARWILVTDGDAAAAEAASLSELATAVR